MLAISAILAKTSENPAVTMRKPHISPAVPPSVSTLLSKLLPVSHLVSLRYKAMVLRQNHLPRADKCTRKAEDRDESEVPLLDVIVCWLRHWGL